MWEFVDNAENFLFGVKVQTARKEKGYPSSPSRRLYKNYFKETTR